jgi:hypothetical protein
LPPLTVPPSAGISQQLLDRLGKMEKRLDWVTKQNEDLLRENKVLAEKLETRDVGTGVAGATPP